MFDYDVNTGGSVFPTKKSEGMTIRDYACIHLGIPSTGRKWLDAMIDIKNQVARGGYHYDELSKLIFDENEKRIERNKERLKQLKVVEKHTQGTFERVKRKSRKNKK